MRHVSQRWGRQGDANELPPDVFSWPEMRGVGIWGVAADTCLGCNPAPSNCGLFCLRPRREGNRCHQAAFFCWSIYTSSPDSKSQARKHCSVAICVSATRVFFSIPVITGGVVLFCEQNFVASAKPQEDYYQATTSKSVQAVLWIKSFFFALLFRSVPCVAKQLLRES